MRALAGKVWSYQATGRRSSECPTEKKGFSVAATPDPESEVIPTAIPGSKEPTGGGMWTVTGAIHCSGRAQMVLENSLPADTTLKESLDNLLSSHVRGVGPRGFPLRLQATEVRINPVEFNPDFIARMIPKVEWAALLEAADTLHLIEVPKEPIQGYEHNEEFLRKMHHMLLEVEVLEGTLQCPESGRLFPISRGIPNMLLSDEETET
ncbi:multifunctional methyltransferase subunit TRM112-like protein [Cervus canadensis]|uniref:multifunctional methyltransferase subunit TRM112-like protein n=1 Tax=Cervus canadensis TaxID=1574408 RepID=UPI001C9E22A2|nr:multifunctional methyltransferase subunit TRM112-like protein [Cervus canadensis]